MTSPRLTFYASTTRTRQQAEMARADREYWAEKGKQGALGKCERCEEEDISPVIEAFELSGQIVCEDCAEEVFQENSQFGVGA